MCINFFIIINISANGNQSIVINYKHSLRIPYNEIDIKMLYENDMYKIEVHTQQMDGKTGFEDSNRDYNVFIEENYFTILYNKILNINFKEIIFSNENFLVCEGKDIQLTIGTAQNNLRIKVLDPLYQSDSRKTATLYEIILDIFKKIDLEEWL